MKIQNGKIKFSKLEKMVYFSTFVIALLFFPLMSVFSKSMLSKANYEVEFVKDEISVQEKSNESLQMKINELASLENFESIAELCIQLKNFHMKKIKFCSLYGNNYHIRLILGIKSNYYSISGIASRYCKIIPGNEINMSATEEYFQCVESSDAIEKILLQTGK